MREADLILEETYETQQVEHAYLEPEAGIAYVDHDDVVTVVSPSQNITHHRHMLAEIIDKPINKVRFIMSPGRWRFRRQGRHDLSGHAGAGGDEDLPPGPAGLSHARNRSSPRPSAIPSRVKYKMGLKNDGRITAIQFKMSVGRRRLWDVVQKE